jgi:hypothetical protein
MAIRQCHEGLVCKLRNALHPRIPGKQTKRGPRIKSRDEMSVEERRWLELSRIFTSRL